MFLVPKKEGEGWVCGWARRCRRWRKKEDPSFLAGCLCSDNPRCPQAPQRPRLLSEIPFPIPGAVAGIFSTTATCSKCWGGRWCPVHCGEEQRGDTPAAPILIQLSREAQSSPQAKLHPRLSQRGWARPWAWSTPCLCQSDAVTGKKCRRVCCWHVTSVPLQDAP